MLLMLLILFEDVYPLSLANVTVGDELLTYGVRGCTGKAGV